MALSVWRRRLFLNPVLWTSKKPISVVYNAFECVYLRCAAGDYIEQTLDIAHYAGQLNFCRWILRYFPFPLNCNYHSYSECENFHSSLHNTTSLDTSPFLYQLVLHHEGTTNRQCFWWLREQCSGSVNKYFPIILHVLVHFGTVCSWPWQGEMYNPIAFQPIQSHVNKIFGWKIVNQISCLSIIRIPDIMWLHISILSLKLVSKTFK